MREETALAAAQAEQAAEAEAAGAEEAAAAGAAAGLEGSGDELADAAVTVSRGAASNPHAIRLFEEALDCVRACSAAERDATLEEVSSRMPMGWLLGIAQAPAGSCTSLACWGRLWLETVCALLPCQQMRLGVMEAQRSHQKRLRAHFPQVMCEPRCGALRDGLEHRLAG